MADEADTIAAIATAAGEGAISIVRIAGPESLRIADRIFRGAGDPPSRRPSHTFVHGRIVYPSDGAEVDEVILLIYRAPHSYTREDVVEIQGHGGAMAARRILRAVLDAGARPAEPGEFTKRAFLNGRIDLLQAEAVLDLIRARSDRAASAAIEQLDGRLTRNFNAIYDSLMAVAADIEATLDFAEDEIPEGVLDNAVQRLRGVRQELGRLLSTWDEGHLLRDGALAVILGKPNVGKSTLLNALLGSDRAIVTNIPGTTRDVIEESLTIEGYPVRIADTAGIRPTDCEIETEGIRRAKELMLRADILIYLLDYSQEIDSQEIAQIYDLPKNKLVLVANKVDLGIASSVAEAINAMIPIQCSLIRGQGIQEIKTAILRVLRAHPSNQPHAGISERHRNLVICAIADVEEAVRLMSAADQQPVLAAAQLRSALETIGEAVGKRYHDALLQSVFSRFCIGK